MDKVIALGDSERRVAFSVYNFPVWTGAHDHSSYEIYPTFVDFKGEGMDIKKTLKAATFLGGVRMAAHCARHNINVVETDDYESACQELPVEHSRCTSIRDIQCPYEAIENHVNPCDSGACDSTEGAPFDNTQEGYLGEECCIAINAWCEQHPETSGCGDYARNMIYNNHCNLAYVEEDIVPEPILYHPILVAEKEAEEARIRAEEERIAAEQKAAEEAAAQAAAELAAAEAAILAEQEAALEEVAAE